MAVFHLLPNVGGEAAVSRRLHRLVRLSYQFTFTGVVVRLLLLCCSRSELIVFVGKIIGIFDDRANKALQVIRILTRNLNIRRMGRKVSKCLQLLTPVKKSLIDQPHLL